MKRGDGVVDLERLVQIPEGIVGNMTRWFERFGNLCPWHATECSNK
jgi:hypothetical protein